MKVTADIMIVCKATKGVHITMRKEFKTTAAIVPGMYLEDRAWKEEREITGVTLNSGERCLYLGIAGQPEKCETKKACDRLEAIYRAAGWRSASEW